MSKYIIKFYLLDGRGWAEQHFTHEDDANKFYSWCKGATKLVSNVTKSNK